MSPCGIHINDEDDRAHEYEEEDRVVKPGFPRGRMRIMVQGHKGRAPGLGDSVEAVNADLRIRAKDAARTVWHDLGEEIR